MLLKPERSSVASAPLEAAISHVGVSRSRSERNDTHNNHSGLFACFKRNKEVNTQHFKSSFCDSQAQLLFFHSAQRARDFLWKRNL